MAPSTRHKNRGDVRNRSRATTPQTNRGSRRTNVQPRKPAVRRVTRFVRKRFTPTKTSARDDEDRSEHEETKLAQVADTTLPQNDKDREVWARKLYDALLNGPNFYQEAGAKAWEVLRSTEKMYRDGPSDVAMKSKDAPVVMELLNTVSFEQHFEALVCLVDDQRVKSDVINRSAEELLINVSKAMKGNAAATAAGLGPFSSLNKPATKVDNRIDLTMEPSEDETSDDTEADEDDASSAGGLGVDSDVEVLEAVPACKTAATQLPTRTIPRITVDLAEISKSKERFTMKSDSITTKDEGMRDSEEEMTYDSPSYFDPDPFWMVHVETMRNRRRSAAASKH